MAENKEINTKKKFVVQALIERINEDNEQTNIKTGLVEGFKQPEKIILKENVKEGYIPDVISETDERIDLYEIEMNEKNYSLEKWKRFSLYSEKANGSFYIITPKSNLDRLKDILDLNKITANILYFS